MSEEQRELVARTFKSTRGRYRNFRSKLSQELSKTNVFPKDVKQRLIAELDKRLDVDLDELLSSPKLRVKLSPAKLDKLLLELYDSVTQGSSGDVVRVISGGANVGRQNLYIKQQQSKLVKSPDQGKSPLLDASLVSDGLDVSTPTSLVKRALKRNLPQQLANRKLSSGGHSKEGNKREVPKMSVLARNNNMPTDSSWRIRLVHHGSFTQSRPPRAKYSPLI